MEWHPEFHAGRTRVKVSFTGGHLCGGATTAASYETSDPVVQKVIESSDAYRSGRIRVAAVVDDARASVSTPAPRKTSMTLMEFADIDTASDFLQHEKGLFLDDLISREQCVAEAAKLGIELKIRN